MVACSTACGLKVFMFPRFGIVWVGSVVAVLFLCGDAYAWGPATHVEIGSTILGNLALLPAGVAAILSKHRRAYLYGNIAADVVFAKRWSRVKQFCHHWSTAFALLDDAKDDEDRAFALGYASHLAADTVAHGKFVPRQILASQCSVNFGHFYWELRGDALQSDETWVAVGRLVRADHDRHHASMETHITDTLLSYDMNRLLFERMNAFAARNGFRRSIRVWSRFSRFELPRAVMHEYVGECIDRVQSVLAEGARSAVLEEDPNGTAALMQLRVRRHEQRRSRWTGRRKSYLKRQSAMSSVSKVKKEE